MSSSKDTSPNFRYFLAGLKPLGRVTVWGPLGLLLLGGLGLWQYRNQPNAFDFSSWTTEKSPPETQWIGKEIPASNPSPTPSIDPDTGLPVTPLDNSQSVAPNPQNPLPVLPVLPSSSNLTPFTQRPKVNNPQTPVNKQPQLFAPLLPNVANPSNILPSNNASNGSPRPVSNAVSSAPLPNPLNAPQKENPLQKALDRSDAERAASTAPPVQRSVPQNISPVAVPPQSLPSLYSNSYQPPAYQSPPAQPPVNNYYGSGNTSNPSGNNGNPNLPSQSAPPSGSNYQSGF